MIQTQFFLVFLLMVCSAPSVHGTQHLSFDTNGTVDICRTGCGSTKFCLEDPEDCDPTMAGACLFVSIAAGATMAPNGTDLEVELSGESDGYIALGLTMDPTMGITLLYICTNSNSTPTFLTRDLNNTDMTFSTNERLVGEIRREVNNTLIQCEFTIRGVNATATRTTQGTNFNVQVGTGTFTGGTLGAFNVARNQTVDVTDPAAGSGGNQTMTATTVAPGNVTVAMTTSNANPVAFTSPASLLLWCFFMCSALVC